MRTTFPIVLLSLCFLKAAAQIPLKTKISSLLDTIETYDVRLWAFYGGKVARYYVNGMEVEKRIYDRYRIPFDKSDKCKPCILKTYDVENELLSIATQYLGCGIGPFTIFHSNGHVKLKGQYRQNPTDNWDNLPKLGFCSIPEGKWYYYSFAGDLMKIETYVDGKLVTNSLRL